MKASGMDEAAEQTTNEARTAWIRVRCTPTLYKQWKEKVEERGEDRSAWLRRVIAAYLDGRLVITE